MLRAAPVSVVAAWDGWCGGCATERPLVLTRTGRRTLSSWWAGLGDDHLPLTLTCRVCGVGVDVPPHEEDDPEPAPPLLLVLPEQRAGTVVLPDVEVAADGAGVRPAATPQPRPAALPSAADDALALLAAGWPA